MPPALQRPGAAAGDQDRQIRVKVLIPVADAAAVQNHGVVEQRAIPVRSGLQLLQEVREELYVKRVDLGEERQLLGVVSMVRQAMVRIGDAELGIGPRADLARQHESRDPRRIRLESEHLQVEHQLRDGGKLPMRLRFGGLYAPFDIADGVEVLVDLPPVSGAQPPLEAIDLRQQ